MKGYNKIIILLALVIMVGILGIVYATISVTLNLNQNVSISPSDLNIVFNTIRTYSQVNGATVISSGSVNGTEINGTSVALGLPGSYVTLEVTAINNNEYYDGKLVNINYPNTFTANIKHNGNIIDLDNLSLEQTQQLLTDFNVSDIATISGYLNEIKSNIKVSVYKDSLSSNDLLKGYNGTSYISDRAGTLYRNNGVNTISDRTETYIVKIELLFDSTVSLPSGYSFQIANVDTQFTYGQYLAESNSTSGSATTYSYVYTVNEYAGLEPDIPNPTTTVGIGQPIRNTITQYSTAASARANFNNRPMYLKHKITNGARQVWCADVDYDGNTMNSCDNLNRGTFSLTECNQIVSALGFTGTCSARTSNNVVVESYVEFEVTASMASVNPGMTAGTYQLKGGDLGASYSTNVSVLNTAFGVGNCELYNESTEGEHYFCSVSGLFTNAGVSGVVNAGDGGWSCDVFVAGFSHCHQL